MTVGAHGAGLASCPSRTSRDCLEAAEAGWPVRSIHNLVVPLVIRVMLACRLRILVVQTRIGDELGRSMGLADQCCACAA